MPKTNMVTAIRTHAFGLLKSKIFGVPFIIKRTNWCCPIRPIKKDAANNLDTGPQGHGIGGEPPSYMHCPDEVFTITDKAEIDWIAGNTLSGKCQPWPIG